MSNSQEADECTEKLTPSSETGSVEVGSVGSVDSPEKILDHLKKSVSQIEGKLDSAEDETQTGGGGDKESGGLARKFASQALDRAGDNQVAQVGEYHPQYMGLRTPDPERPKGNPPFDYTKRNGDFVHVAQDRTTEIITRDGGRINEDRYGRITNVKDRNGQGGSFVPNESHPEQKWPQRIYLTKEIDPNSHNNGYYSFVTEDHKGRPLYRYSGTDDGNDYYSIIASESGSIGVGIIPLDVTGASQVRVHLPKGETSLSPSAPGTDPVMDLLWNLVSADSESGRQRIEMNEQFERSQRTESSETSE